MFIKTLTRSGNINFIDPFLVFFTSFIGGFTAMKFPKKVLDFFTEPLGQYLAFISILYIYYKDEDVTKLELALEAVIYVVILQIAIYTSNIIFVDT